MDFAIVNVPVAVIRKKPDHKNEMANQLLFGEMVRILKERSKWLKIQSLHDNYEGWVRKNQVAPIDENFLALDHSFIAGELINTIEFAGNKMLIPFGSTLPAFSSGKGKIGEQEYIFNGYSVNKTIAKPSEELTRQSAMQWLNAPYLWGGRTILGVDCSGFTQVIFKMLGFDLLRDARQQINQGMKVKRLEDAQCGDLAFFEKKKKIVHVGILLNSQSIIHASGKVRIDKIDNKGIIHSGTGERTHTLAGIKRYWQIS